jgi:hypothetical protein
MAASLAALALTPGKSPPPAISPSFSSPAASPAIPRQRLRRHPRGRGSHRLSPEATITLLEIGGALQGASVPNGTGTVTGSGYVEAGHIWHPPSSARSRPAPLAPETPFSADGAILAANDIASLTVTGAAGIAGTSSNSVSISAVGQAYPGRCGPRLRQNLCHTRRLLRQFPRRLRPDAHSCSTARPVSVQSSLAATGPAAISSPASSPPLLGGPYGGSVLINSRSSSPPSPPLSSRATSSAPRPLPPAPTALSPAKSKPSLSTASPSPSPSASWTPMTHPTTPFSETRSDLMGPIALPAKPNTRTIRFGCS